ncbi:hypothetical protein CP_0494 [Chlamydia pneumoniae AR39]|uniref:Uncharacterized protein n=1 Tax=Chlamydia pneumoniae TaxID=83558 RepID=Q9K261_CHLPN|nr:hypothetical protein CP_0494 [Chlamydia pneumoniae AR39]
MRKLTHYKTLKTIKIPNFYTISKAIHPGITEN